MYSVSRDYFDQRLFLFIFTEVGYRFFMIIYTWAQIKTWAIHVL